MKRRGTEVQGRGPLHTEARVCFLSRMWWWYVMVAVVIC